MLKPRRSASGLFLMELILAIFFFMLTSAVCVQIFVQVHLLSRDARALTFAVSECSAAAEIFRSSDTAEEAEALFSSLHPDAATPLTLYFDKELKPCGSADRTYTLTVSPSEENGLLCADITFTDKQDETVYALRAAHHPVRRAS